MRHDTITFSADASLTKICEVNGSGHIQIAGTFGSGTFTLFVSFDGGTTKNAMKDLTAVAYSTTSADTVPFDLSYYDKTGSGAIIYGTLSGSTNPALTVKVIDDQKP